MLRCWMCLRTYGSAKCGAKSGLCNFAYDNSSWFKGRRAETRKGWNKTPVIDGTTRDRSVKVLNRGVTFSR